MMKIKEIIKEYQENLEIKTDLSDYIQYDSSSYICDEISACADNMVDYYNSDLIKWCAESVDNVYAIEEALGEFGTPQDSNGNADFYKIIQQGQYYKYEQDCYDELEEVVKNVACACLLDYIDDVKKEIKEEDFEDFIENLNIDSNDRCDDILDKVKEFLECEEDY